MVRIEVRGALWLSMALWVGLAACGGPPGPNSEVLERSPRLPEAFQAGLAIAPTAHLQPVAESAAIAARFSNSVHIEALTQMRGVEILSPEFVLEGLARHGEAAMAEFREARRALARDTSPSVEMLRDIADHLGQRYLLFTWVDEGAEYGMEDMPVDYTDSGFANDVRRAKFGRVEGDLYGVVIDLEGAEVLWKGRAHYESEKDFGVASEERRSLEDEARVGASYDLIGLLVSPE